MSDDYEAIIERFYAILGVETQHELAQSLGIKQSSVSNSGRRRSIPCRWFLAMFDKFGVNPDWLRSGVGPVRLRLDDGEYVAVKEGSPRDCHYSANDQEGRRGVTITLDGHCIVLPKVVAVSAVRPEEEAYRLEVLLAGCDKPLVVRHEEVQWLENERRNLLMALDHIYSSCLGSRSSRFKGYDLP